MSGIGRKAEHVRAAVATGGHECHWPGCTVQVAPAKWGCKRHWYMLPHALRDRIWQTYSIGQEDTKSPSREYIVAARDVQDWIARYLAGGGHS